MPDIETSLQAELAAANARIAEREAEVNLWMKAFATFRIGLRDTFYRYGIRSNPGWSDGDFEAAIDQLGNERDREKARADAAESEVGVLREEIVRLRELFRDLIADPFIQGELPPLDSPWTQEAVFVISDSLVRRIRAELDAQPDARRALAPLDAEPQKETTMDEQTPRKRPSPDDVPAEVMKRIMALYDRELSDEEKAEIEDFGQRLAKRLATLQSPTPTAAEFNAALDAENVALRQLLRELVAPEKAGIDDSGVYAECICCGALAMTNLWRDVTHAPDCPIVRGRALVQP